MPCSKCGTFHDEVIRVSEAVTNAGFPTEGAAAWALWDFSTRQSTPVQLATSVMDALGYVAFQGYPLTRKQVNA